MINEIRNNWNIYKKWRDARDMAAKAALKALGGYRATHGMPSVTTPLFSSQIMDELQLDYMYYLILMSRGDRGTER